MFAHRRFFTLKGNAVADLFPWFSYPEGRKVLHSSVHVAVSLP